jgi:Fic-DOC domain mobile mystery protein B
MDIAQAIDDARFWVENATYAPDEIAVRHSHRLVAIHPFPNGNGRLSRMVGDLLAIYLGQPRFSWGSQSLIDANVTRTKYVAALRAADAHDLAPLISFARS